jgi:ribonuclease D
LQYESIKTTAHLQEFCEKISQCEVIAFDTEFVSETTYRPVLCLIQVATDDGSLAIIDPIGMESTAAFWELIASGNYTVLAHAAREETRFCYRYSGKPIGGLFDTQLAAGFVGLEYPASLGTLVSRLVGKTLPKGETRTDWERRPLTKGQIDYALADVTELIEMYHKLADELDRRDRWDWLDEECDLRQLQIIEAETRENWRRVAGASGLSPRQLEIVRQLWLWREAQAKSLDRLPKRILRDDLIIELARHGWTDVRKIRAIRGLERRHLNDQYEEMAQAVERGLATPDNQLPNRTRGNRKSVSPMLSQFLSTSMACISRQQDLAPSIVGNTDDVKEFLGAELEPDPKDPTPVLRKGWRGEIVGPTLRKVLDGELSIRVVNVREPQPLEFAEVKQEEVQ